MSVVKVKGKLTPVTLSEEEAETILKTTRQSGERRWKEGQAPKQGWLEYLFDHRCDEYFNINDIWYQGNITEGDTERDNSKHNDDGSIDVDIVYNDRHVYWTEYLIK